MVWNAKGKILMLPKQINQSNGKVLKAMGFNEVMWGKHCKSYVVSVKGIFTSWFNKIVQLATAFIKTTNQIIDDDCDAIEIDNDDDYDIRANIINISSDSETESKSECKLCHIFCNTCWLLTIYYLEMHTQACTLDMTPVDAYVSLVIDSVSTLVAMVTSTIFFFNITIFNFKMSIYFFLTYLAENTTHLAENATYHAAYHADKFAYGTAWLIKSLLVSVLIPLS